MRSYQWIVRLGLAPHDVAARYGLLEALAHLSPIVTEGNPPALEVQVSAPSGDEAILYVSAVLARSYGPLPEVSSVLDLRQQHQPAGHDPP